MLGCHGELSRIYRKKKCIASLPPQNPVLREDVSNISTGTGTHPMIHLEESRGSCSTWGCWHLRFIVPIPQSVGMGWWVTGRSHITQTRKRVIRDTGQCSPATHMDSPYELQSQQSMQLQLRKWVPHILSGFLKFFWSSSVRGGRRGERGGGGQGVRARDH